MDNKTAHAASDYESEVARTIPFHGELLRTAIDCVLARGAPARWLDTGAGPGQLVELARARAPSTTFVIADPSEAMLTIARARHPGVETHHADSEKLPELAPVDAITAILCHHYCDDAGRYRAVKRCRELLAPGGTFVVFENVRAETDDGHESQRKRLADWQRSVGRDDAAIAKHLAREGTAFFPIRVSEHLALLARIGFTKVEIVWRAYGQAGFEAR